MAIRFENGIVTTLGQDNQVMWNATVVTEEDRIAAVGDSAKMKKQFPNAEAVDCSGKIILPGFLCTHHHFYSTMSRGMAVPGEPASNFVEILERLWWRLDRALTEEDITLSAQIPLIECIRNGTTTVIDHHASPGKREGSLDLIEKAVRQAGIRASLCYEVSDRNEPGGGIAENERFIKKIGRGDGQIAAMMGLHASFTLSDKTLETCVGIARQAGVGCHIHVAEDAADREDSLKKYHTPTVKRLEKLGVTGERSIFVHCVHIDTSEMDILAATKTSVVHNPESNMNNAVGVTQLFELLKRGILVGMGTDGMSSDMLAQMRCAYLLHRLANRDPRVGFLEAPQLLLQNNAEICERQFGLRLGEISEGRPADLAILDYQPPTPLNTGNFLGHLIFGLVDAVVDTTVCRGKVLMKNKKILVMDEERIAARSRELAARMWKRL
ncbi:MAG: putative aminohydrolase SsnA [Anaerolineales bacterium]|jgi:putative selenium metabolism protein SsnA